jgi:hypothetical protein
MAGRAPFPGEVSGGKSVDLEASALGASAQVEYSQQVPAKEGVTLQQEPSDQPPPAGVICLKDLKPNDWVEVNLSPPTNEKSSFRIRLLLLLLILLLIIISV